MKLYHFPIAPNPARVLFYLNEKGLDVERVLVDVASGEQRTPGHLARNPDGVLPVLELDDGSFLTESLTIMEYLEERFPRPPMIGQDPLTRARVRQRERWIEMNVLLPVVRLVHATNSPLGRPPNKGVAKAERPRLQAALVRLEGMLADAPFVMGEWVSIADCTLLAAMNFAAFGGLEIDPKLLNLQRWFDAYASRHVESPAG